MFDEVVECMIQLTPGVCQRATLGEVGRECRIEEGEARREDSAVGLGEQHGYAASEGRELVTV